MKNILRVVLFSLYGIFIFFNCYTLEATPLRLLMKEVFEESFLRKASKGVRFFSVTKPVNSPGNSAINTGNRRTVGIEEESSKKTVRILTIDGGGIRGIIPLKVLEEIEKRMGRPTHQLFDVIGGASTGGIISLCLTAPHPEGNKPLFSASNLLRLYMDEGRSIFHRFDRQNSREHLRQSLEESLSPHLQRSLRTYLRQPYLDLDEIIKQYSIYHRIKGPLLKRWVTSERYLEKTVQECLREEAVFQPLENFLGEHFHPKYRQDSLRSTLMNHNLKHQLLDQALTTVFIPSFSLTHYRNHIFRSTDRTPNSKHYMVDVAMATSAAPTYFDPYGVRTVIREPIRRNDGALDEDAYGRDLNICIDGGISLNNPTLLAYIEARSLFPEANHFVIFSLGTGFPIGARQQAPTRDGGLFGIAKNFHLFNDSQIRAVEQTLEESFRMDRSSGIEVDYYRMQVPVAMQFSQLDDVSNAAINHLSRTGQMLVDTENADAGRIPQVIRNLQVERVYDERMQDNTYEKRNILTLKPGMHLTRHLTMRLEEVHRRYGRDTIEMGNTIHDLRTRLQEKVDSIREKDDSIVAKDTVIQQKDNLIASKDSEIQKKIDSKQEHLASLKTMIERSSSGIFGNRFRTELQSLIERYEKN